MNKYVSICALILTIFFLYNCSAPKAKQPNFLFILVDDQPFDAVGFNGRYPFLETPNMDKLRNEGMNFENYFVTMSLCSPSRASILTGTYPHINGANQNSGQMDPDWDNFQPYTTHLQSAGYETAMVGKIHMAHKKGKDHIRPGFDYWLSFNGQGDYFNPKLNENGREFQVEGYMTDILTDYSINWLREKRDKSKPFCLHLWHKAVHEDHSPAPRHNDLYKDEKLPEPPFGTHKETFKGKPEWQRIKAYDINYKDYVPVDELPEKPWGIKEDKYMKLLKCLRAIDESLGKVMAELEAQGELENTVIIYSSDNGYFMGEHTYWDKRIAYENSIRVPLIVRYPSLIKANSKAEQLCLNIDIAPSILELAGVATPDYTQGESFVNILKGEKPNWRDAFMFEYYVSDLYPYAGPNMLAVRTERYKLIDGFLENDIDELYDLQNDPGEMNNLINNPEFDEIESKLRTRLEELKEEYKYNPDRDWWLRQVEK